MNVRTVNIILFVVLVLIVTATFMIRGVPTERNIRFLPGMVASIPAEPQTDALPHDEGNAPLNAVPGTFSRDVAIFPSSTSLSDSALPVEMLSNPVSIDSAKAVQRGGKVYTAFCAPCHGGSGAGDGTIAMRGYPPPPSLLAQNAVDMSDAEMYMIISQGFRNMPSYMSQISENDRWNAVVHIRTMQRSAAEATAAKPAADTSAIAEATPEETQ